MDHLQVSSVLKSYDLFFLPTRGENFGHVIMESLSVGTPVLISNKTPWRNLEKIGVGWELPLFDEQKFADKIYDAAQISREEYKKWRLRVQSYGLERAVDPEVISANRRLFIDLTNKS